MNPQHIIAIFILSGVFALMLRDVISPSRDEFLDEILPTSCLRKLHFATISLPVSIEDRPLDLETKGPPPPEVFAGMSERLPRWEPQVYVNPIDGRHEVFCRIGSYWLVLEELSRSRDSASFPEEVALNLMTEIPLGPFVPREGNGLDRGIVYHIRLREGIVMNIFQRLTNEAPVHGDAPQRQRAEEIAAIRLAKALWGYARSDS